MTSLDMVFGSINVHRADCNRDHYHPCDSWDERASRVGSIMHGDMRCSVYACQECMPEQASDLADYLGWGDEGNPPYVVDENQNAIIYDRKKWTDRGVIMISLSKGPGDKADQHRRSIMYVLLEHIDSGVKAWFGSAHLENGDADERTQEALYLVDFLPPGAPMIFGIDRNSYTTSEDGPRAIFEDAGLEEIVFDNPDDQRSFNQWDHSQEPKDGKSIDGQHTLGMITVRDAFMVYTTSLDATDHNGLVSKITINN